MVSCHPSLLRLEGAHASELEAAIRSDQRWIEGSEWRLRRDSEQLGIITPHPSARSRPQASKSRLLTLFCEPTVITQHHYISVRIYKIHGCPFYLFPLEDGSPYIYTLRILRVVEVFCYLFLIWEVGYSHRRLAF